MFVLKVTFLWLIRNFPNKLGNTKTLRFPSEELHTFMRLLRHEYFRIIVKKFVNFCENNNSVCSTHSTIICVQKSLHLFSTICRILRISLVTISLKHITKFFYHGNKN